MKILTTSDAWSIECGDDEYYHKGEEYKLRLMFNAKKLSVIDTPSLEPLHDQLSNLDIKVSGRVIFKDQYLLIIENEIRFAIVLNNEFRFGNHNYIGNKEIDHSLIKIGDAIEAFGYFKFQRIYFCIFTFLPNEISLPKIDYKWKVTNCYKVTGECYDSKNSFNLEEVGYIDTSSQSIEDEFAFEFKLINDTPLIFDYTSGCGGFVGTSCWIDKENRLKNCEGRIISGVKKGKWTYIDKTGEHKREFIYEEI